MGDLVGLTGATGFVGSNIFELLSDNGYEVNCLVRNPESDAASQLKSKGATLFKGDVTDKASIDPAFFQRLDYLIHLVGIIKEVGANTFEGTHFEGTRNLVDLAEEHAGIRKFVHMSALGTRPDAKSKYHQSKWKGEEYVRASGLNYTIFRPSIIHGPKGEFIEMFVKFIKYSPVVPAVKSGLSQPIYVRDVAACFVNALKNSDADRKIIPLGGPERFTLKEMIEAIMNTMGKKRALIPLPPSLLYIPALVMQTLLKDPPITTQQLVMVGEDNICDIDEVKEVIPDFSPRSFKDCLQNYLKEYLN